MVITVRSNQSKHFPRIANNVNLQEIGHWKYEVC